MESSLPTAKMTPLLPQFLLCLPVVWAQLEVQNVGDNSFVPDGPVLAPALPSGVMDPSSFTSEMKGCQQHCGDGYYKCFMTCDASPDPLPPTKIFFQTKPKQQWSSYLLSILTFGYYGNKKVDKSSDANYDLSYVGDTSGLSGNNCMKNCTKFFRVCYRHCVCKTKEDVQDCMSELVLSSNRQNFIDSQSEFTARFEYITTKDKKSAKATEYQFDWGSLT